ncbi:MAG: DUF6544 family protein [Minwuia sp.]|uniref:DUF6544 family protein n=1 Tax=Minwuia sp. TaxID=2493630 RepID=UPI003A8C54E5
MSILQTVLWAAGSAGVAAAGALLLLRLADRRRDAAAWRSLSVSSPPGGARFDPAMVGHLPEPARRYFGYMIRPGAPLHRAVSLGLRGEIGLGTREKPGYRPFVADQVLACPAGLVWRMGAGAISGTDAMLPEGSWSRFRLFGLVPVARVSGNPDHFRSAFGRVVAEAAFWTPAALLPGPGVTWSEAGPDTARAVVSAHGLSQAVDIVVADDGRPLTVCIQRWSNENPGRVYRLQPFGGVPSDFEEKDGYRLPLSVEGGNHFGTPDYFPFYRAKVTSLVALG